MFSQHIRPAMVSMVLFTLILGLAYPLAMTGLIGLTFPDQAAGSLVRDAGGRVIGSALIAQGFTAPGYVHPRPSAAGSGYDPLNSGGSNLGPLDPKLIARVKGDAAALAKENGPMPIAADAVTTSASGLDPDISPANAAAQAARVATARGVKAADVQAVIEANTAWPILGVIGDPAVNVLAVNRTLDARFPMGHPRSQ
jgi:K+-transporting ATPase ATPase C chain